MFSSNGHIHTHRVPPSVITTPNICFRVAHTIHHRLGGISRVCLITLGTTGQVLKTTLINMTHQFECLTQSNICCTRCYTMFIFSTHGPISLGHVCCVFIKNVCFVSQALTYVAPKQRCPTKVATFGQ